QDLRSPSALAVRHAGELRSSSFKLRLWRFVAKLASSLGLCFAYRLLQSEPLTDGLRHGARRIHLAQLAEQCFASVLIGQPPLLARVLFETGDGVADEGIVVSHKTRLCPLVPLLPCGTRAKCCRDIGYTQLSGNFFGNLAPCGGRAKQGF